MVQFFAGGIGSVSHPGAVYGCMRFFKTIIGTLILVLLASCHPGMTLVRTGTKIDRELGKQQGTFAVAFTDMSDGEELLIREREVFHAASTMKTPVMIEVFKQAASGRFSLSDSLPIQNEFRSLAGGSPF